MCGALSPSRFHNGFSVSSGPALARGGLLLALLIGGTVTPAYLSAQGTAAPPRHSGKAGIFAIAGALIGGALGFGFGKAAKGSQVEFGLLGAGGGAFFGYFIGKEYDKSFAQHFRGVQPLRITNVSTDLDGDPVAVAARDTEVAVAGSVGVQLFNSRRELEPAMRRGAGLRGLMTVDIAPRSGWLATGSPAGLYVFPPGRGPGSLVREGAIEATAAGPTRVYFAVENRIEVAPVDADTTRSWPGVVLDGPARDLHLDVARSLLWALTDRELIAFHVDGDSLARVGAAPLETGGRRIAISAKLAAIALGEHGVELYDIADPAHPRKTAAWTISRFAYDVALDASRLFIAAGPEGVYVVDVSGPTPRTIGLARSLGFVSALAADGGYTFIVDRRSNALRRIASDF